MLEHLMGMRKAGELQSAPNTVQRFKRNGNFSHAGSGFMQYFSENHKMICDRLKVGYEELGTEHVVAAYSKHGGLASKLCALHTL